MATAAEGPTLYRRPWVAGLRLPLPGVAGAAVIATLAVVAVLAPFVAPHDPNAVDLLHPLASPSADHLLGTDASGRDVLSRLMFGARMSLLGPLVVVALSTAVGVPLGLLAGYQGGWSDALLSRAWDVLFAFPPLLLAITVVAAFGAGFWSATVAIAAVYAPLVARVVRGVTLAERHKPYTDAMRVIGFSGFRISLRHVLPNVAPPVVAQSALNFGYAVIDLAGLAFLGLGIQPPTADWGQMLADGRDALVLHSTAEVVAASTAIAITVVAFNMMAQSLIEVSERRR
jgi:peptide/nickel transport system permease protein